MSLGDFIISFLPTNSKNMASHPPPQIPTLSESSFKYLRYIERIFGQRVACRHAGVHVALSALPGGKVKRQHQRERGQDVALTLEQPCEDSRECHEGQVAAAKAGKQWCGESDEAPGGG